jgi:hypothetical protein
LENNNEQVEVFSAVLANYFLFLGWTKLVLAAEQLEVAKVQAATWAYVTFAVTVTLVKIVALAVGFLVAKLGYQTMMAGVQGSNAVELGAFGTKLKFKGVTPGLALGLAGVLMMGWALSAKHHFSTEAVSTVKQIQQSWNLEPVKPKAPKEAKDEIEKAPKF